MKEHLSKFKENNPQEDHKKAFRIIADMWKKEPTNPANQTAEPQPPADDAGATVAGPVAADSAAAAAPLPAAAGEETAAAAAEATEAAASATPAAGYPAGWLSSYAGLSLAEIKAV